MEMVSSPSLYIDQGKVKNNSKEVVERCGEEGISIAR